MPSAKVTPARSTGANTSFLPVICGDFILRQRRLDIDIGERQIAGDLVAKQHPDLLEEFAKRLCRNVFPAQQCQLVLHQRVANDRDAVHV